ncbi:MAG: amino acid ABC transporter permease [Hyphomicrobiales bacterium]|nr:amino acid ABC transporter permease [Hyphomicrobiales bacterium]
MAVQDGIESSQKASSFIYDPKVRSLFSQAVLIAVLIWLGYSVVQNTIANLERQNIASGFGFLDTTAGFAVGQSLIAYSEASSYGRTFVVGLLNTLLVSVIGIAIATVLGFIFGIARLSNNWVISKIAYVYVEVMRNLPLLLQIFFWYFAVLRSVPGPRESITVFDSIFINNRGLKLPKPLYEPGAGLVGISILVAIAAVWLLRRWARKRQMATGEQFPVFQWAVAILFGLPLVVFYLTGSPVSFEYPELRGFNFQGGLTIIPEFVALLLALSVYTGAFIAEIVRAGILAVSRGQTEASYALGLRPGPTLRLVVIPQALRVIIPPLTSQYLNLTKNSSLAVAIAYPDLVSVFAGTTLNQTGQAVEILGMTLAVYLTLSLLTSALMNWYNRRVALVER